jgi:hypothetical protein
MLSAPVFLNLESGCTIKTSPLYAHHDKSTQRWMNHTTTNRTSAQKSVLHTTTAIMSSCCHNSITSYHVYTQMFQHRTYPSPYRLGHWLGCTELPSTGSQGIHQALSRAERIRALTTVGLRGGEKVMFLTTTDTPPELAPQLQRRNT